MLLFIYKSLAGLHLDYGDIIYGQPQSDSFCNKLKNVQYYAVLAVTGASSGTSKSELYKELGLEFLESRRWFDDSVHSIKLKRKISPYLAQPLPKGTHLYNTLNSEDITRFQTRTETFKFSFFPWSLLNGINLI